MTVGSPAKFRIKEIFEQFHVHHSSSASETLGSTLKRCAILLDSFAQFAMHGASNLSPCCLRYESHTLFFELFCSLSQLERNLTPGDALVPFIKFSSS